MNGNGSRRTGDLFNWWCCAKGMFFTAEVQLQNHFFFHSEICSLWVGKKGKDTQAGTSPTDTRLRFLVFTKTEPDKVK